MALLVHWATRASALCLVLIEWLLDSSGFMEPWKNIVRHTIVLCHLVSSWKQADGVITACQSDVLVKALRLQSKPGAVDLISA